MTGLPPLIFASICRPTSARQLPCCRTRLWLLSSPLSWVVEIRTHFLGFRYCKYFSKEATGHHTPSVAYISSPSSASSSSLWFLVYSSRTFDTNLAPVASVWTSKSAVFWIDVDFDDHVCKNTAWFRRTFCSEASWGGLNWKRRFRTMSFFSSSSSIGDLCCTLAWPSFFCWIHWAVKTLLASLNSTSFILSVPLVYLKYMFKPNRRVFKFPME